MAISAQDKIMYVANKLGLSTLNQMQGSTGGVYDSNTASVSQSEFFTNASQHVFVNSTNITDNEFEVNEALLIESIGFYSLAGGLNSVISSSPTSVVKIVYSLTIGNKIVLKDMLWTRGIDSTFTAQGGGTVGRAFMDLEGVGILIPPQVKYSVSAQFFDQAGAPVAVADVACALYGTAVLLNFNTSI
jgi:hypothetical protein